MKFLKTWQFNLTLEPRLLVEINTKVKWNKYITRIIALSTPHEIYLHNVYVWKYFNAYNTLLKKPYWDVQSCILARRLISLNIKNGRKLKIFKILGAAIRYIYSYFIDFNVELSEQYAAYAVFWEFSKNFPDEFYTADFCLRYIYLYTELVFLIKRAKLKKKKKKKIQSKMLVSYIPGSSRLKITSRLISTYINQSSNKNITYRLGDAILYLILSGKQSFLYKKKISMYARILEKKKFY